MFRTDIMSSSSGWSATSIEGLSSGEVTRLLEHRRVQLRALQLETQLVEQEARRLRGVTASPCSPATSVASVHQQPAVKEVAETRRSLHAPSPVGSLLSLHDSRCSTPLPSAVQVAAAALSPRPPSNMSRRGSRNSRRSSSSGERNAGRLPRTIVQQLVERAAQEAQRQLEALRLRDAAQQRHLQMRTEAVRSQSEAVRTAHDELKRLEQRTPLTMEALDRWETSRWIAGTEREARRLRLQLGVTKLREKRAAHRTSEADLELLKAHTQRRHEEITQLQSSLRRSHSALNKQTIHEALIRGEEALSCLRREVAAWRARTQERRNQLFVLRKRNQLTARHAIALENGGSDVTLKMVTEYACLRGREQALRNELVVWERRQALLRAQLHRSARRRREWQALQDGGAPAPHSSPVGSSSRGEGSEQHQAELTARSEVLTPLTSGSPPQSTTSASTSSSRYQPRD